MEVTRTTNNWRRRLLVTLVLVALATVSCGDVEQLSPEDLEPPVDAERKPAFPASAHALPSVRGSKLAALADTKTQLAAAYRRTAVALQQARVDLASARTLRRQRELTARFDLDQAKAMHSQVHQGQLRLTQAESAVKAQRENDVEFSKRSEQHALSLQRAVDDAQKAHNQAKEKLAASSAQAQKARSVREQQVGEAEQAQQSALSKVNTFTEHKVAAESQEQAARFTEVEAAREAKQQQLQLEERLSQEAVKLRDAVADATMGVHSASARLSEAQAKSNRTSELAAALEAQGEALDTAARRTRAEQSKRIEALGSGAQDAQSALHSDETAAQLLSDRLAREKQAVSESSARALRAKLQLKDATSALQKVDHLKTASERATQRVQLEKRKAQLLRASYSKESKAWGQQEALKQMYQGTAVLAEHHEIAARAQKKKADATARESTAAVLQLDRKLKLLRLAVTQAKTKESEAAGQLQADNRESRRDLTAKLQRLQDSSKRQLSQLLAKVSTAQGALDALKHTSAELDKEAMAAEDRLSASTQAGARAKIAARAAEKKQLRALDALEAKQEATMQHESDAKISASEAMSQVQSSEATRAKKQIEATKAVLVQRLQESGDLTEEEQQQAKTAAQQQLREAALRAKEMQQFSKHRAAAALQAAEELSGGCAGCSEEEKAARAAQLQAMAEGANRAAKKSGEAVRDAKKEKREEGEAIQRAEERAVQQAQDERVQAKAQAKMRLESEKRSEEELDEHLLEVSQQQQHAADRGKAELHKQLAVLAAGQKRLRGDVRAKLQGQMLELDLKLQERKAAASSAKQAAQGAHKKVLDAEHVLAQHEAELRPRQREVEAQLAKQRQEIARHTEELGRVLQARLGLLHHAVQVAKDTLAAAEAEGPALVHAEAGTKTVAQEMEAQWKNAQTVVVLQHRSVADLDPKIQAAASAAQAAKSGARLAQGQLARLQAQAGTADKAAEREAAGAAIAHSRAEEKANQAGAQLSQDQASLHKSDKKVAALDLQKTKAEYAAEQARASTEHQVAQARALTEQAEQRARDSREAINKVHAALSKDNTAVADAQQAVGEAEALEEKAQKRVELLKAEKAAKLKSQLELQAQQATNAKQVTEEAAAASAEASKQLLLLMQHKQQADEVLDKVRQQTEQPAAATQEAEAAASDELELTRAELVRRMGLRDEYKRSVAQEQAAREQKLDRALRVKQLAVNALNREMQTQAHKHASSAAQTLQAQQAEAREQDAKQRFDSLKQARLSARQQYQRARESWAVEEELVWKKQRGTVQQRIDQQRERAAGALKEASQAEAMVHKAQQDAQTRILQLQHKHSAQRAAMRKEHNKQLKARQDGQAQAIASASQATERAKEAALRAEEKHQQTVLHTEQLIRRSLSNATAVKNQAAQRTKAAAARVQAAEASEQKQMHDLEEHKASLVAIQAQEQEALRSQRDSEGAKQEAQERLEAAHNTQKQLEDQQLNKVASAREIATAAKQRLMGMGGQLHELQHGLTHVNTEQSAALTSEKETRARAAAAKQLRQATVRQSERELEAQEERSRTAALDSKDEAEVQVDTEQEMLRSQLQIVKQGAAAKVAQAQQQAESSLQQTRARADTAVALETSKKEIAMDRFKAAQEEAQQARAMSEEASREKQGFRLKTAGHRARIDAIQQQMALARTNANPQR